jgi:hypothetical protein
MKNAIKILFITSSLYATSLKAQEVISSCGESVVSSNIQVDFTIGEVVTETYQTSTVALTQGFHQTFMSSVDVKELTDPLSSKIYVYPNPVRDRFTVEVKTEQSVGLSYEIVNMNGSRLQIGNLSSNRTEIPFKAKGKDTYILYVKTNGQVVKTIKLIKQ